MLRTQPSDPVQLRERAQSQLARPSGLIDTKASTAVALRVLHDLAASSETAADALALLHELQVHQVELDLQAEELRNNSAELEVALARQAQLYEAAPAAYVVLDAHARVSTLNASAAQQLRRSSESLRGQPFERWLSPTSRAGWHGLLARAQQASTTQSAALLLDDPTPTGTAITAYLSRDPGGPGSLLVWCPMSSLPPA